MSKKNACSSSNLYSHPNIFCVTKAMLLICGKCSPRLKVIIFFSKTKLRVVQNTVSRTSQMTNEHCFETPKLAIKTIITRAKNTLRNGVEPLASRLTVSRSTNWANGDLLAFEFWSNYVIIVFIESVTWSAYCIYRKKEREIYFCRSIQPQVGVSFAFWDSRSQKHHFVQPHFQTEKDCIILSG